jgi:hypothetical protein
VVYAAIVVVPDISAQLHNPAVNAAAFLRTHRREPSSWLVVLTHLLSFYRFNRSRLGRPRALATAIAIDSLSEVWAPLKPLIKGDTTVDDRHVCADPMLLFARWTGRRDVKQAEIRIDELMLAKLNVRRRRMGSAPLRCEGTAPGALRKQRQP